MKNVDPADIERLSYKLAAYQPLQTTLTLIQNTPIVFLVGISGAGKDTLKERLLLTAQYHHIVSHTTRPPRLNHGQMERDGVEYHFINLNEAERMIDEKAFIEVKRYGNNIYGTSVAEIQTAHDTHKIAMTDLEVQGVAEYKSINSQVKAIFLLPPSYEVWQSRLHARYGEQGADPADLSLRLQTAQTELEHAIQAGYFEFVINDNLEEAVKKVDALAHGQTLNDDPEGARRLAQQLLANLQKVQSST